MLIGGPQSEKFQKFTGQGLAWSKVHCGLGTPCVGWCRMGYYALDLLCLYSFRQEDQESFKLKDSQNYASCLNL